MKKILILSLLLVSTAIGDPAIFVVNNLAETMSRIDILSGGVQNHVTVLGETPNDIELHNGYLYVVNSVSADAQKIDPSTNQAVANIPLPIGSNPYSIEASGEYAYVSGWISGDIYRINLNSNGVDSILQIGGFPEGILVYGNRIYVAQTGFNPDDFSYGQGRIAVIDINSFLLIAEINVGTNPQSIIGAEDGMIQIVCTGNYGNVGGSVYFYNTISGLVQDSVLIGGQPVSGVISEEGVGYLAAGGWVSDGYVYSYDISTKQVLRGPSNPILVGIGVTDIAIDSMGVLYTANFGGDSVTKLSLAGQVQATYQMGDGPQALIIMDDRVTEIAEQPHLPEAPYLLANYPNPFNGNTIIRIGGMASQSEVRIKIMDIQGRVIKTLYAGTGLGLREVSWDATDNDGAACASGIYVARVEAISDLGRSGIGQAIKMTLVR